MTVLRFTKIHYDLAPARHLAVWCPHPCQDPLRSSRHRAVLQSHRQTQQTYTNIARHTHTYQDITRHNKTYHPLSFRLASARPGPSGPCPPHPPSGRNPSGVPWVPRPCPGWYVLLCFSMFQYVSVCFNMFQYVSVCFSMFHYVSVCSSMFHYKHL